MDAENSEGIAANITDDAASHMISNIKQENDPISTKRGRGRPPKISFGGSTTPKKARLELIHNSNVNDDEPLSTSRTNQINIVQEPLVTIPVGQSQNISQWQTPIHSIPKGGSGQRSTNGKNESRDGEKKLLKIRPTNFSSVVTSDRVATTTEPAEDEVSVLLSSSIATLPESNASRQRGDHSMERRNKFAEFMANMQMLVGYGLSNENNHDAFFKIVEQKFNEMSYSKQENAKMYFLSYLQNIVNEGP